MLTLLPRMGPQQGSCPLAPEPGFPEFALGVPWGGASRTSRQEGSAWCSQAAAVGQESAQGGTGAWRQVVASRLGRHLLCGRALL